MNCDNHDGCPSAAKPEKPTANLIGASWRCLLHHAKDDLLFCTVIIGGVPSDDNADYEDIKQKAEQQVMGFRASWRDLVRRRLPGLVWRGAIEFDLVRGSDLGEQRAALFADLGVRTADRVLVPHMHAVVIKGAHTTEKINEEIRRDFPGRWRVLNKHLYENQTVPEALTKLYGYVHKQRLQYSSGGIGDSPTKFGEYYEIGWMRIAGRLYREIKCEFRSKS